MDSGHDLEPDILGEIEHLLIRDNLTLLPVMNAENSGLAAEADFQSYSCVLCHVSALSVSD